MNWSTALTVAGLIAVGIIAWRYQLPSVQADVIEAYEKRIKQLECAREADREEISRLRNDIAELRGEVAGQRELAKAIIEVVGEANICLMSPNCSERVTPSA